MTVQKMLDNKGSGVISCASTCTIQDAAKLLAKHRIGALLVMSGDEIEGVVSERDIVRGIADGEAACLPDSVASIMTPSVITCAPSDSVDDAMGRMTRRRIRHLPVVDGNSLVGMISIGDVVKAKIASAEQEAEALKSYIATG